MTLSAWDAATGVPCPQCDQETYRLFLLYEDKRVCRTCHAQSIEAEALAIDEYQQQVTALKSKRADALKHGLWVYPKVKRPAKQVQPKRLI